MRDPVLSPAAATTTWDGQHDTSRIDVTVVYFVPADRQPLPDWRERAAYYCRRIEQFHEREFQGRSALTTDLIDEPLISRRTTPQLRQGDANAIFFSTLREAAERRRVDQPHVDHVEKMHPILEAIRNEFHRDQPIEIHDPVAVESLLGVEARSRYGIGRLDPLARIENVNRLPGLAMGTIHEDVDPEGERVDEPDRLQGLLHPVRYRPGRQILRADQRRTSAFSSYYSHK